MKVSSVNALKVGRTLLAAKAILLTSA